MGSRRRNSNPRAEHSKPTVLLLLDIDQIKDEKETHIEDASEEDKILLPNTFFHS